MEVIPACKVLGILRSENASAIQKTGNKYKDLVRQDRIRLGWNVQRDLDRGMRTPREADGVDRINAATRPKGRGGGGACSGRPLGGG